MSTKRTFTVGVLALVAAAFLAVSAGSCRSLFYPPEVESSERYTGNGGVTFDHSGFDALLRAHVRPGGYVDYEAFARERDALDLYVESLADAPFDDLGRDEKLAFWINAYNACTITLITENMPLQSIRDIPAGERWDAIRWKLAGQVLSLNQIEHERVRKNFREPRIHFALVCAAIGCPPLRAEAYTGANLEAALADQTGFVHRGDRWFRFDRAAGELGLTKLYDWYAGDFEQSSGSAVRYAAGHSPELAAALAAAEEPSVSFLDYDWSLNSVDNAK